MCGIAGMMSIKNKPISPVIVDNMLLRIKHRGPDDTGVYGLGWDDRGIAAEKAEDISKPLFLAMGFNRLSIQDLSKSGHQPMLSENQNIILTFNGEIYNTAELKQKLSVEGCTSFKSSSDTEVVLKCYEVFGIQAFHMLNGMFAIVLLDLKKRKLLIARDKCGIIPIHILKTDSLVAWGSEIKCFLDIPEYKRTVNLRAVSRGYLYFNPSDPIYEQVENVDPGTYYELDLDNPQHLVKKQYFSVNELFYQKEYHSEGEVLEKYEQVLKDCVKRQMISDVPLGLQLSGGIDSSSIAYWASRFYTGNGNIKTFSMTQPEDKRFDEKTWIECALKKMKADSFFFPVDDSLFLRYFEKTVYAYEKLLGVQNGMGIYEFSKGASDHVTVLLSGEGADEICGGYGLAAAAYDTQFSFNDEYLLCFDRQLNYYENGQKMIYGFDLGDVISERLDYLSHIEGAAYQKIEALWMKEELVNLLERQNKITMANSVENRVPFLDDEIIKFFLSLPLEYIEKKSANGKTCETKYIMKKMCEQYFGVEFAYREKQGMGFWISKQITSRAFKNYLQEMVFPKMEQRGIINMEEFYRKYNRMLNGQDVLSVWKAINIEIWMQLFVDGRLPISDTSEFEK